MDGIIALYKPRGMTSFDCVAKIRRIVHEKRVGHSGTLDPNVDGVLPICVGQATKVVNRLMASGKIYRGQVTIGFATTTEDLDGEIIDEKPVKSAFSDDEIQTVMNQFLGEIIQVPPMFSAVKVNGRRLYDYARAGEEVTRPERKVTISRFEMLGPSHYDAEKQQQTFEFEVECSKGTYIRTLAVDVSKKLGFPGVMSELTRIQSGGFTLSDTVTLEMLEDAKDTQKLVDCIRPIDDVFSKMTKVKLSVTQWQVVQNGGFLKLNQNEEEVALEFEGHIKAIYQLKNDQYFPEIMLLRNNGVFLNESN